MQNVTKVKTKSMKFARNHHEYNFLSLKSQCNYKCS